ncbi:MAG: hypothetical protein AAF329_21545 [Cyanobacteria bacterium P01_A01_bin.17]
MKGLDAQIQSIKFGSVFQFLSDGLKFAINSTIAVKEMTQEGR